MASFIISNVPQECNREDLKDHFISESSGGGPIKYVLFPLGKEGNRALICFNDSRVASTLPNKKQVLHNATLRVRPAPRETYQKCTAEVDPLVVASIPDLYQCTEMLQRDCGIETEFSDDTGSLTLIGSLLQIQTAQTNLDQIFQEQQDLQRRELIQIGQSSLSTPVSSLHEPFKFLDSGHGDGRHASRDDRTITDTLREPIPQSRDEDFSGDRRRDPVTSHLSTAEEYERLGQSLPAMHISADRHDTEKPTRHETSFRPIRHESPEPHRPDEVRPIETTPLAAERGSSTYTRKTSLERSLERINDMGHASPQSEFPATTTSRTVDDIFERSKTRSTRPLSAHELETSHPLSHSLPYDRLAETGWTRDWRASSLPDERRSYSMYGRDKEEPALTGGQQKPTYNVDTREWEYKREKLPAERERAMSHDEEYHSLPATLAYSDTSRVAAHGFGRFDPTEEIQYTRKTRSVDDYEVTRRRHKPPSGNESTGIEETAELDTNVVAYLQKIHYRKVREMEIFHGVNMFYETQDEVTTVHISPVVEYEGVHMELKKAKEEFINFYQTIFYSVVKESIVFDPEKISKENHKAITDAVKTAFSSTLYVKDDNPGEIMLVGAFEHMNAAADWIKLKLGLRRPHIEEDIRREYEDTSRIKRLQGVRSEYILDPETGKSKLSLVMHSNKSRKDGRLEPHLTGRSLDERKLEQNRKSSSSDTRKSRSRERPKLSATEPCGKSETSKSSERAKRRPTVAETLSATAPSTSAAKSKETAVSLTGGIDTPDYFPQTKKEASLQFRFTTKEGICVSIFTDNITNRPVDVIVSAANEYLKHVGGIAAAISDVGGPQFQQNCTEYVITHGQLKVAEAVAIKATGDLKCQHVIQSVGPMWCLYTNKDKCASVLQKTFHNAFECANTTLRARSIAVPAISTGVYDVPLDVCARSLFGAIVHFSQEFGASGTLREIQIVNKSEEISQVMAAIFQQLLGMGYQDRGYDSDISSLADDEEDRDEEAGAQGREHSRSPEGEEHQHMSQSSPGYHDVARENDPMHGESVYSRSAELTKSSKAPKRSQSPGLDDPLIRSGQGTPMSGKSTPRSTRASGTEYQTRSTRPREARSGRGTPKSGQATPRSGQATPRSGQGTPRSGQGTPRLGQARSAQGTPVHSLHIDDPEQSQNQLDLREDNVPPEESVDGLETAHLATSPKRLVSPRPVVEEDYRRARDTPADLPADKDDSIEAIEAMFYSAPAHLEATEGEGDHRLRRSETYTLEQGQDQRYRGKPAAPQLTPRHVGASAVAPRQSRGRPTASHSSRPGSQPAKSGSSTANKDRPDRYMVTEYNRKIQLEGESSPGVIVLTFMFSLGEDIFTTEDAYLPNTVESRAIGKVIKTAFDKGKVWCVTEEGHIQHNITLKTSPSGGPESHGYPDPEYLTKVKRELLELGFPVEDF